MPRAIIALTLLLILAACSSPSQQAACLADAKVCPDGTTLSRTGPECSFPDCPAVIEAPVVEPTPAAPAQELNAEQTLRAILRTQPDAWSAEYTTRTSVEGQASIDGDMRRSRDGMNVAMRNRLSGSEVMTLINATSATMCLKEGTWQCSRLAAGASPETSTTDADVDTLAQDFIIRLSGTCNVLGESGTSFRFIDKEDDSIVVDACYTSDGLLLRAATSIGGIGLSQQVDAKRITRQKPAASDFTLPTA